MPLLTDLAGGLLELLAPEACALCGAVRDGRRWCGKGPLVAGLRRWDAPHLCEACALHLAAAPGLRIPATFGDDASRFGPVWAGRFTDAALVTVVGAWKYQGLRGLAWPLAALVVAAARRARAELGPDVILVPVPLHPRRRRTRGFNQAALLAALVGAAVRWPVRPALLARRRATPQQARLQDDAARTRNLAGACRAASPGPAARTRNVLLVDDIVTSGATAAESARALSVAGWQPRGTLALGLRPPPAG